MHQLQARHMYLQSWEFLCKRMRQLLCVWYGFNDMHQYNLRFEFLIFISKPLVPRFRNNSCKMCMLTTLNGMCLNVKIVYLWYASIGRRELWKVHSHLESIGGTKGSTWVTFQLNSCMDMLWCVWKTFKFFYLMRILHLPFPNTVYDCM